MEKNLRSSLHTSAAEFLSAAAKLPLKSSKTSIKNIINSSVSSSSDLASALVLSLGKSISKFKTLSNSNFTTSPVTPPAKRVRRSGRNKKNSDVSPSTGRGNERQSVIDKLQVYTYILRLCVFHPKDSFPVSDLLPAVQELHDNLILFESESILLSDIANLCEEWWKGDLLGKETLITQSLPVILSRSLTSKKKVDVHRVYTLRDAFTLFDFEDESIVDLKDLLIRCVISPLYLKTEDGKKFISFMFGLSTQLAKELFAMIKSQIPFGRKSMLEGYGEIIFRAWKAMDGEFKDVIENGFLLGLFEGATYASSAELGASIRRVIGAFVNNRTTEGVEKLIFRLAEPVIFRSLQVANSNVRQNALHLLLDLFPVEDPDATKEATDTLLEKQFFLLEKLLMDECPDVRAVAVEGCCRSLHMFWEIIPSPTITKIITKILDQMTHDACNEVRLSTVNGLIYLLGNPQSHEVLKVLLPRLGHLIMDSASVVRIAVTDLLLLLNDIRNFHFHKVVRLEVLFSTLANDQPFIAKKLTKLLVPSYFPSKVTEEEACKRFLALIQRSPVAGARFCEFAASEGVSLGSLLKLFKVIIGLTLSSAKLEEKQIEGLLLAVTHLCNDLVKDASFQTAVKEELSGAKLKALFAIAPTTCAKSSVCNIITTASLDNADDLLEECMSLVKQCSGLSVNIEKQAELRSAHKMILSCGCFDDMLEALVGILQKTAGECSVKFGAELEKQDVQSAKRRKTKSSIKTSSRSRSGRKSSNTEKDSFFKDYAIAAGVAWQIKDLLLSETTRKPLLGSVILERAYFALKVITEASILHFLEHDYFDLSPIIAYTTLALHLSVHNVRLDGCKISGQETISDLTIGHLLRCTYKVFTANDSKDPGKFPSDSLNFAPECSTNSGEPQTGAYLTKQTSMTKSVRMLTYVLEHVVEATGLDLISHSQDKCLNFTTEMLKFITTKLRNQSISQLQILEQDLKDIFNYFRSSFTYAAKLLNMAVKTPNVSVPHKEANNIVNELFNFIVSVEEFLGYRYAVRFNVIVQPWLPDLILGLVSFHLLKLSPENANDISFSPPSWLYILARIELHELRVPGSDEETEKVDCAENFSAFKKLIETMSELLKANYNVLDAVGVFILNSSLKVFENKDFKVVLGLLRFICLKLLGSEHEEWMEAKLILESLKVIYSKVETEAGNVSNSEEDIENLNSIRTLLEPFKMIIYEEEEISL